MQSKTPSTSTLGDETLSPYDFAMEEVNLALSQVTHVLAAGDPNTIEEECANARSAFRRLTQMHPRLRLESSQRESLLRQLALLRSRIEECEGGNWSPTRASAAKV